MSGGRPVCALLCVLPLLLGACGGCGKPSDASTDAPTDANSATEPTSWPAGTVLVVDDVPILAADAEPWVLAVGELYPEYTRVHCRRLALTNVLLPMAAARDHFAAEREEARREAEAARARIEELAETAHQLEDTWRRLGLELWAFARGLPPGTWSEPTELLGRWVIVRLDEVVPGRVPSEEKLNIRWLQFPYVDPDATGKEMRAAVDASRLLVVDPAWGEAVPEEWKRRMKEEE